MAAMAVAPAPDGEGVVVTSCVTPALAARNWVSSSVPEPRSVTPRVLPLKSAAECTPLLVPHIIALARRAGELDDVDDVLALGLEVDGVDVPGAGHVHLAGGHRVLGADAAVLLGGELHVHAVLLVEAEALGELVRQVDLLVDAADHQLDGGHRSAAAAAGGPLLPLLPELLPQAARLSAIAPAAATA